MYITFSQTSEEKYMFMMNIYKYTALNSSFLQIFTVDCESLFRIDIRFWSIKFSRWQSGPIIMFCMKPADIRICDVLLNIPLSFGKHHLNKIIQYTISTHKVFKCNFSIILILQLIFQRHIKLEKSLAFNTYRQFYQFQFILLFRSTDHLMKNTQLT